MPIFNPWTGLAQAQVPTQQDLNASSKKSIAMGELSPEEQALQMQLQRASNDSIGRQQEGVDALKQQLAQYNDMPAKTDLTPLLALADTWTGSNLAKSYKAPATPEERLAAQNQLQSALTKAQGGVSEEQLKFLKDQSGLFEKQREYAVKNELLSQNNADRKQQQVDKAKQQKDAKDAADLIKYQQAFNGDKAVVEANKGVDEVIKAQGLLDEARTNPVARQINKVALAKTFSPSRLNETEISAAEGSKKLSDRIDQALQDLENGTLTDENYNYMSKVLASIAKSANHALDDRSKFHTGQYVQQSKKPFGDAFLAITGKPYEIQKAELKSESSAAPAPKTGPAYDPTSMTYDEKLKLAIEKGYKP